MVRIRVIALVALLALVAVAGGGVLGSGRAGATAQVSATARGNQGPVTRTCQAPRPGGVSCLARPVQQVAPSYTTRPTPPSGLSPGAIATAYGFPPGGGSGETIAVVDAFNDPTATTDLAAFSAEYGLPTCSTTDGCFAKVNETGGGTYPATTNRWALEMSLDIEWAHALAPYAHILLVEATTTSLTDMFGAVGFAAQHAQYVSMSWGGPEFSAETSFDSTFTSYPGVSFFAASGDSASSVLYPSSSPDVVSVGGTTLTVTASTGAWKSETAWSSAGGGCSVFEAASAAQRAFPTYDQSGASCNGFRATPDVAFDANPTTGVSVYDTVGYGGGWFTVGGTSVSTVMMAARSVDASAHIDSTYVYGPSIRLYNVTTGNNGHPCEPGYNLCTGLGSWNTSVGVLNGATTGTLSFTPTSESLTAGSPSAATTVHVSVPSPASGLTVSLSSTTGGVSSSPTGPFTSTASVTVPPGQTTSPAFYLESTGAGTSTLSASATGWTSASQTDTVGPGPLARIAISPASTSVPEGGTQVFTALGFDAYGNPEAVSPTWTASAGDGSLTPPTGARTVFRAGTTPASFTLTATSGSVSATAPVSVTGLSSMTVSITDAAAKKQGREFTVPLTVSAASASGPLDGAAVTVRVTSSTCGGPLFTTLSGSTTSAGTTSLVFATPLTGAYCATAVVSAGGYRSGTASVTFTVAWGGKKGPR